MTGFGRNGRRWALIAGLLLASCTHHRPVAIETPAPAVAAVPRPELPTNLAAVVPPPLAPDGAYRTINYGIDPVQTEWHVRAALNVAAIGCRGAADAIGPQAAAVPAGGFETFAATALPRLEAPFLDTYRQVDAYRVALAQWKAGGTTQLATAAPTAATSKLTYADMRVVMAWQAEDGVRVAAR